ncbi:MAG: hypothetical protein WCK67_02985 [bacterium]
MLIHSNNNISFKGKIGNELTQEYAKAASFLPAGGEERKNLLHAVDALILMGTYDKTKKDNILYGNNQALKPNEKTLDIFERAVEPLSKKEIHSVMSDLTEEYVKCKNHENKRSILDFCDIVEIKLPKLIKNIMENRKEIIEEIPKKNIFKTINNLFEKVVDRLM